MPKRQKTNIAKKTISWAIGFPAALLSFSEDISPDSRYWWVPFTGLAIVIAILWWNGAFKNEGEQTNFITRRR